MLDKILPRNTHRVERVARVVIGVVLILLVFIGPKTPFGWLGIVPLVTGLVGSCPLYTLFGFSTCARKTTTS